MSQNNNTFQLLKTFPRMFSAETTLLNITYFPRIIGEGVRKHEILFQARPVRGVIIRCACLIQAARTLTAMGGTPRGGGEPRMCRQPSSSSNRSTPGLLNRYFSKLTDIYLERSFFSNYLRSYPSFYHIQSIY